MATPRWRRVRWNPALNRATLVLGGAISAKASARLEVRRPGGGPLLSRRVRLGPGPFRVQRELRRGRLVRGAQLFPGAFVTRLSGRAGRIPMPMQVRTVELPAPAQGVVRNAFVSASSTGRAQASLPFGVREAYVTFRFAAQPRVGPITVTWYDPRGRALGAVEKSNRPVIQTGVGSPAAIPRGAWIAELRAAGRLLRRVQVRIV